MKKITEQSSPYQELEKMGVRQLLDSINKEDQKVAQIVSLAIPALTTLVEIIVGKMQQGGRLFYIGAGTSGRLGILDAAECPPSFGVPDDWVIALIAGGDGAIRKAVEHAEDDSRLAWQNLQAHYINDGDVVIGIAASGSTPYVVHGLRHCRANGITTACICCNPDSPLAHWADHPIELIVGPEFVTGSTRMKAGTAQKLVLNMISTSVMIRLGRVRGNTMVDMQLTNKKLLDRGARIIMRSLGLPYDEAMNLLRQQGSVRTAIDNYSH